MEAETQAVKLKLQKAQESRSNISPKPPLPALSRPDPSSTRTENTTRPVAHRQAPTITEPTLAHGDSQLAAPQQLPLGTGPQRPPSPSTTTYQDKPSKMNNPPPGYQQPRPSQYVAPIHPHFL